MNLEIAALAARRDLIPTIAGWFSEEWPDYFADDPVEHLERQANTDELPIALVVFADNEPAGTVALKDEAIDGFQDRGPWIGGLYVRPEARGHGVGELLVTSATRVAWAMGHEAVYTGTRAIGLFEKLGWSRLADTEQDAEEVTVLELERPEEPPTYYERIGGEETVRALVDRFYDLMDDLDEAAEIRAMHAKSLKSSRQKLFEFLSGWLGGPQLYIEKRGHPRLRMRHMPFSIGTEARDQWLLCMDQALEEVIDDERIRGELAESFVRMADHMRNRRGP